MYEKILKDLALQAAKKKDLEVRANIRSVYYKALANTNAVISEILKEMYKNKYEGSPMPSIRIYKPEEIRASKEELFSIDDKIATTYYNRNNKGNEITFVKAYKEDKLVYEPVLYSELVKQLNTNNVAVSLEEGNLNFNFINNREVNIKKLGA